MKEKLSSTNLEDGQKLGYTEFQNVLLKRQKNSSGWYIYSINIIKPLMNKKSELLDSIRQNKFPDSQAKFKAKEARYNLKDCIILAKAK